MKISVEILKWIAWGASDPAKVERDIKELVKLHPTVTYIAVMFPRKKGGYEIDVLSGGQITASAWVGSLAQAQDALHALRLGGVPLYQIGV